jgi:hypothetical protein
MIPDLSKIKQFVADAEQDPYWAEQFRLIDQWKQAIRDQHDREPTAEELEWYFETQGPQ